MNDLTPGKGSWTGVCVTASVAVGIVLISLLCAVFMTEPQQRAFVREWGTIESLSLVALGLGVALLLAYARLNLQAMLFSAYFLALIAAREMDAQSAFTTGGIERTRYYVDPEVPLLEKSIVVLIISALIAAFVVYFRANWTPFCDGLRRRDAVSWSILIALSCFVLGKLADSGNRIVGVVGLSFGKSDVFKQTFEESTELAGACAFLMAALFATLFRDKTPSRLDEAETSG